METNENQNANTQNNAQSNDWQTVKTGEVVGKPEAERNYNGIAIASFICGLVGLFYYQIPCGIAALITGIIGLIKYNPEKEKGKWMSITGIVLGSLEILWGILIIMLGIGIFFSALGTM